jgi:hypothetical protein
MLKSVIGDYLDTVTERGLDLPFLALLRAMGYYDVHYTHGQAEFGKDFIAKKSEDRTEAQFSFQLKAGDIGQSLWRNEIMGQMLESVLSGLSHPSFDRSLPHYSVLVTTGRLTGNAALGIQEFNERNVARYKCPPIRVWDRQDLLEFLTCYGLDSIHRSTSAGFSGLGEFFTLYGQSFHREISPRSLELHARYWLQESTQDPRGILVATVEAEMLAGRCGEEGLLYEAIQARLGLLRTVLRQLHGAQTVGDSDQSTMFYSRAMESVRLSLRKYLDELVRSWNEAERNLVRLLDTPANMLTYLVHCSRFLEMAGLLYFCESDKVARRRIVTLIEEFASREPGCGRVPGDRYAVSLVLPVIALLAASKHDAVQELIRRAVVWLCDRNEQAWGLPQFEDTPFQEIVTLFGYPYEFFEDHQRRHSFAATVACDLAAFMGDRSFYADVVNDVKAVQISPVYWQVQDTEGLYSIEAPDVITYPYVEYSDSLDDFSSHEFAAHIQHEPHDYRVADLVGPVGFMGLMLHLRDRYFPTLWPALVDNAA